jgi:hypothetical protein
MTGRPFVCWGLVGEVRLRQFWASQMMQVWSMSRW